MADAERYATLADEVSLIAVNALGVATGFGRHPRPFAQWPRCDSVSQRRRRVENKRRSAELRDGLRRRPVRVALQN